MPTVPAGASGGHTWAGAVLTKAGVPVTTTGLAVLHLWATSEGNLNGRGYNWLNTTQTAPGATSINSVGVKNYASFTQGVAVTASELRSPRYNAILRALAAARPTGTGNAGRVTRVAATKAWTAINKSPWCGGCQGGKYPNALWTLILGKGATGGGVWPTSTVLQGTQNPTAKPANACVWKLGPGLCILNESQARALKGGLLVVAGGLVMFVGLAVLGAYGFGRKTPLGKVTSAARKAGVGGGGTRQADRIERAATPAQRQGTPTPAGERVKADYGRSVPAKPPDYGDTFTDADRTPALARRTTERRPHSRQHTQRSRARSR